MKTKLFTATEVATLIKRKNHLKQSELARWNELKTLARTESIPKDIFKLLAKVQEFLLIMDKNPELTKEQIIVMASSPTYLEVKNKANECGYFKNLLKLPNITDEHLLAIGKLIEREDGIKNKGAMYHQIIDHADVSIETVNELFPQRIIDVMTDSMLRGKITTFIASNSPVPSTA